MSGGDVKMPSSRCKTSLYFLQAGRDASSLAGTESIDSQWKYLDSSIPSTVHSTIIDEATSVSREKMKPVALFKGFLPFLLGLFKRETIWKI